MSKKILIASIALFLFSSTAFAFTDSSGHENEEAINYLEENNVVQGYSDDTYRPDNEINRAEFLKIILESLDTNLDDAGFCFPDVKSDWYAPYVCKAKSMGIVSGYADGNFKPTNSINLAEALKIILEAYDADTASDSSTWYAPYLSFMEDHSLLTRIGADINESITRGEMAQLIYNLDNYYETPSKPEFTYKTYETTNEEEGFGYMDENPTIYKEKSLPITAVERENVKVLVPTGYEVLAEANIEDLLTCQPLISDFLGGINFPKDKVMMKIYVSNDDSYKSSSHDGTIIYRRAQEGLDFELQDIETNNPEGFLYNSSKSYCANTHELTHGFFSGAPLPSWADEGLAQFTQKNNQGTIYDHIECKDNGYYSKDEWRDYSDMSTDNVLDYNTSMCFIQELVDTYGLDDFHSMLARLNKFQTGELVWNKLAAYHFVNDVLEYIYGDEILNILKKYGINEEDYSV